MTLTEGGRQQQQNRVHEKEADQSMNNGGKLSSEWEEDSGENLELFCLDNRK